ncbi:hypothetical protein EVAR_23076_1 [Eumeta japonica]|uniref:Uncharacterized protein n=1 Tax=Eumeta variegata TaxID=151549 RepID=A0A4C1VMA1_EUMVA|nr:hypothetical protein EVAR_23076_1 [Eumeta japonica]
MEGEKGNRPPDLSLTRRNAVAEAVTSRRVREYGISPEQRKRRAYLRPVIMAAAVPTYDNEARGIQNTNRTYYAAGSIYNQYVTSRGGRAASRVAGNSRAGRRDAFRTRSRVTGGRSEPFQLKYCVRSSSEHASKNGQDRWRDSIVESVEAKSLSSTMGGRFDRRDSNLGARAE